ncbi:MAG: polysaccharide biosynthesis protein [Bacteroidetes bacterium]|nr:MAG: polysaccharide biosynthesis protein [Bacteroidota bacterium]
MSIFRKLVSQTAIYGISTILARLMNLLLTPLYTNNPDLISQADFGSYINLYAFVAFVNVLLSFGMETTFFRYVQDSKDAPRTYALTFSWVALVSLAFTCIALPLYTSIANIMGYGERPELLLLLAGIVVLDALASIPLAKLRHEDRTRWFATITLTNVMITISLNLVLILGFRMGIEGIFIANLAASGIKLLMSFHKNLPAFVRPRRDEIQEMLNYAFFIMLAGFAGIMNETLDRVMLPYRWGEGAPFDGMMLSGKEMNGIYGANYKVAMLISLATQAFRYAAEPFFFRNSGQKDSPETFAKVFHYFMIASMTGFLLIASFALEIEQFNFFGLTGKSFVGSAYWSGVKAVPILLLGYVCSGAYINMSIWFKITKQTRFAMLFTGTGAAITIAVNYFGIPIWGYMACAWATLLCYVVMTVLVYVVGQKYYPVPYRVQRLLLYLGLFVGAWLLNAQIGWTSGDPLIFAMKLFVALLAIGIVAASERFLPVFRG